MLALSLTGWSLWSMPSAGLAANLVEVAAGDPEFSTLVTAVQAAGWVDTLKGSGPITLFAPNNAALAKFPAGTLLRTESARWNCPPQRLGCSFG